MITCGILKYKRTAEKEAASRDSRERKLKNERKAKNAAEKSE